MTAALERRLTNEDKVLFLHLPKTAGVMDRALLVRSLGHGITAHGPGTVYMATGHPPAQTLEYPSLGALAARVAISGTPRP